ncbi:hypothetical protein [Paracoccus aerodenitrificans]|uniref:hypothetical protein n=1 Tax=Paracoccus aerodenitrificans TaxID=3017781 RepID=UPI0022F0131C|nr:hypothetical protein [Paracoccus aerodenitrificans]WBU65405.1 hypothetical protein PAE61_08300 [Paracoccus aerodenitrificans]
MNRKIMKKLGTMKLFFCCIKANAIKIDITGVSTMRISGNMTKSAVAAAVLALSSGAALAQVEILSPGTHTFTEFGTSGAWKIYADQERQSCLVEGTDPNGNVVQMGLTSDHNLGYVGIFTPMDVGIRGESEQDITIAVDGNLYSGTAQLREHGISDNLQGGYFPANNPNFVNDMRNGQTMVAFENSDGAGVAIDLTGTNDAYEAARECTEQFAGM